MIWGDEISLPLFVSFPTLSCLEIVLFSSWKSLINSSKGSVFCAISSDLNLRKSHHFTKNNLMLACLPRNVKSSSSSQSLLPVIPRNHKNALHSSRGWNTLRGNYGRQFSLHHERSQRRQRKTLCRGAGFKIDPV